MTHTTTDAAEARALTVIQADRDAAARVAEQFKDAFAADGFNERFPLRIREGVWDEHWLVEAFAGHRLATAEAASGAGEREGIQPPKPSWCGCYPDPVDGLDYICDRHLQLGVASLPPATDPAMGLDHATVERCANVVGPREGGQYSWLANRIRALAAAPTIPATGEAEPKPLRVDWNKHDLAEAYDLVEGVRSKMAQSSESPLDTSLRAALNAIEAADCEWDGLTKAAIPAAGHAATDGEGA